MLYNTEIFFYVTKIDFIIFLLIFVSYKEQPVRSVMVIVVENGHGDSSSNPGRD